MSLETDRIETPDVHRISVTNLFSFAVLTPAGRGAIATLGLAGPASLAALQSLLIPPSGRNLASYEVGSTVFGRFRSSQRVEEDVIVGILADNEVEIHCHGGQAAVAAICEVLTRAGGIQISSANWAQSEAADPIQSEALIALAEAKTERAAAILLDQYRGALTRELQLVIRLLDQGDRLAASQTIKLLMSRADLGPHLTRPWKVVFTGRPNVGKSSLMNAILGYQRSIVWHEPGTTRDVLTASAALDGWLFELSDVAGLRTSGDALEAAGVERAEEAIAAADLLIFASDLTADWDDELYQRICEWRPATAVARTPIVVHNKCDVAEHRSTSRPAGLQTSAITGTGLPQLCQAISKSLVPSPPDPESAIPFTQRQLQNLEQATAALTLGDLATARKAIQTISKTRNL